MLSCLPVSLFSQITSGAFSVGEWSCAAASMGLDAFDISILFAKDRTPTGIAKLKAEIESGGLPLAMVATYPDFTTPDPIRYETEIIRELADISIAAELGAKYVRITAGQIYHSFDETVQLDQVSHAFQVCADYADKWGISLLWENHSKPGAWNDADFNYDNSRLDRMQALLTNSPIKMNYDIANAFLLNRGIEYLETCFPNIASIHINDVASVSPIRFAGIGDGLVPISDSISWLLCHGFNGLFSIEEASMSGLEGIRKYVGIVKKLLKDVPSNASFSQYAL